MVFGCALQTLIPRKELVGDGLIRRPERALPSLSPTGCRFLRRQQSLGPRAFRVRNRVHWTRCFRCPLAIGHDVHLCSSEEWVMSCLSRFAAA